MLLYGRWCLLTTNDHIVNMTDYIIIQIKIQLVSHVSEGHIWHALEKCNGSPVNFYVYFGFMFFGSLIWRILCTYKRFDVSVRNYSLNRLLSDAFNIILVFCSKELLVSFVLILSFLW